MAKGSFDYVILRLPDVIGPRDSLIRFWLHQMWLQFLCFTYPNQTSHQIPIQKHLFNKITSYVYVGDVARFVHFVLLDDDDVSSTRRCRNDIVNVAFETGKSVQEFLSLMARHVKSGFEQSLSFYSVDFYEKALDFDYPSVTKGAVDVSKMRDKYGFEASQWDDVMKLSVEFYNRAYNDYPYELETTRKLFVEKFIRKNKTSNNKEYNENDLNKFLECFRIKKKVKSQIFF